MKRVQILLIGTVFSLGFPAFGFVDTPDPSKLSGNAYHDGGWISFGTDINKDNHYLQFDAAGDFLYSPRYGAPIRKILLETRCSAKDIPTRFLTVTPYVNGIENTANVRTNATFAGKDVLSVAAFDFTLGEGVDAFRLGMAGSTGTWGVTKLAVIWGEKTADEDKLLYDFAQQLPTPENVRVETLTENSLTLGASDVTNAAAYVFELAKLTGCPRTELREDFVMAPKFSEGWSCDALTEGLTLSDGGKSYSDSATTDEHALKVEKGTNPKSGTVEVGLVSPLSPEPIAEWSFVARVGTTGKSNSFSVWGRKSDKSAEWILLAENLKPDKQGSNQRFSGTVETAKDIRQVRFALTADASSWTTAGLDSLCAAYGGNEEREIVSTKTNATAMCDWKELATGRYGCRVKAAGGTEGETTCKDSSWSEEQVVDLAWARIRLTAPTGVTCENVGDKLVVGWVPVTDAERYVVSVFRADDMTSPYATVTTKSSSASVAIEELGEYAVTVTAISPGNVSTASATVDSYEIRLGKLSGLKAVATKADTIEATWSDVPLAEGYQAKLFKVEGDAGTIVADYSGLPNDWPKGWDCSSWLAENLSKNGLKFTYVGQWARTGEFPAGVTKVLLSVKSASGADGRLANQYLTVEACTGAGDDWRVCATIDVTATTVSKPEVEFPVAEDIRRIRFTAGSRDGNYQPSIQLGAVTVTYGSYVRTEVASVGVGSEDSVATFGGLDRSGRYVVVVTPQPSEGTELEAASQIVDLAAEYFRPVGPVSIAGCRDGVYAESFDSLAAVKAKTDLARAPLSWWQLHRGSGEAQSLYYTAGTNGTSGGAYCYSDGERSTNSYMIGTLASGTMGCALGIAFVNDTDSAIGTPTLTFTSVQRNFKANPSTYVLEWLVTDGPWSIGTESADWKALTIPETAPFTSMPEDGRSEYRETGIAIPPESGADEYKAQRLKPGQVIIFRWRHEKLSNGPMMGLDDVRLEFPVQKKGLGVVIR